MKKWFSILAVIAFVVSLASPAYAIRENKCAWPVNEGYKVRVKGQCPDSCTRKGVLFNWTGPQAGWCTAHGMSQPVEATPCEKVPGMCMES